MTDGELIALRMVLDNQQHTLLDRLQIGEAGIIEPDFLHLLTDNHTSAAVDVVLAVRLQQEIPTYENTESEER
jgi:hypothetical protein